MEKEFEIGGRKTLVEKTSSTPYINGVAHQELQVRRQILDQWGNPVGYHLSYRHVTKRATWAQIEGYLTPQKPRPKNRGFATAPRRSSSRHRALPDSRHRLRELVGKSYQVLHGQGVLTWPSRARQDTFGTSIRWS